MDVLENSPTMKKVGAVLAYSMCSSTLLLANKVVMTHLPLPSVVSILQIIFATITCLVLKYFGGVPIDDLELAKVKPYSLYIIAFVTAIFSNMQALNATNVETVIVFRSCTPVATSFIEYFFMNRALPSTRSWLSLAVVGCGAFLYCIADSQLAIQGINAYFWVIIYFCLITFEMTYGKQLTSSVKMESVWGPVFYQNILSIIPMTALGFISGEIRSDTLDIIKEASSSGLFILIFSCITGTLIGYTAWLCRSMLSATTFTLVGVVNKFLTILLNVIIWDKHATPVGTAAVCMCLCAGIFYRQAPRRQDSKTVEHEVISSKVEDLEKESLINNDTEENSGVLKAHSPLSSRCPSNDSGVTTVSTQGSLTKSSSGILRNNSIEMSDHLGGLLKTSSHDSNDSGSRKKKQHHPVRYF